MQQRRSPTPRPCHFWHTVVLLADGQDTPFLVCGDATSERPDYAIFGVRHRRSQLSSPHHFLHVAAPVSNARVAGPRRPNHAIFQRAGTPLPNALIMPSSVCSGAGPQCPEHAIFDIQLCCLPTARPCHFLYEEKAFLNALATPSSARGNAIPQRRRSPSPGKHRRRSSFSRAAPRHRGSAICSACIDAPPDRPEHAIFSTPVPPWQLSDSAFHPAPKPRL